MSPFITFTIPIPSSHLCLDLPSGLSFMSSHQTLVCAVPSCMPCVLPISSPQFVHPNNIWHGAHIIQLPICSSLHSAVTSSLTGPNIFPSTLSFNTFSLCSSRDVTDQVSHPYKIMGKISVLCTLICILDSKWEDKLLSVPRNVYTMALIGCLSI